MRDANALKLRRALEYVAVAALCVVGAVSMAVTLTPLPNIAARPLTGAMARPEPADVIIVLSAARYSDGTLSEAAILRTVAAVQLYHRGLAPKLLFTGGSCCGPSPSAAMATLARELAVPPAAIMLEEESRRTRESARNTAVLLRQLGVRRALLVTSRLHLARSELTFRAANVSVIPVPAEKTDLRLVRSPAGRAALVEASLHEYLGLLYYKLRGWI